MTFLSTRSGNSYFGDFGLDFKQVSDVLNSGITNTDNYPFYSIAQNKVTEEVIIKVALAGFSKEEIDVSFESNNLIITAEKESKEKDENIEVFKSTLSERKAVRKFALHTRYVGSEDIDAEYTDGILTVKIKPKAGYTTKVKIN